MTARRKGREAKPSPHRIGVLISGRGSNLMAILDRITAGDLDARVALVICNRPEAAGAEAARVRGIETLILDQRESSSREAHDRRMAEALEARGVQLVCLAGYMRLLSPWFIDRFRNRILNIHPSLLPAFPGVTAQRDALEHGARVTGCTVHFVDVAIDTGPIILQEVVPVCDDDTAESLAARILAQEHRIYSRAIALFFTGRLQVKGRRVIGTDERERR
jgi:phosphoribosylglycinamide formyltransferase-1